MSENLVKTIYLGIGSNLGNRRKNIELAKFKLIQNDIIIRKSSNIYESLSWPNPNKPKFLNIILEISSNLSPSKLIDICKKIEINLGRQKRPKNAPRECDIDIIDYYNQKMKDKIILPHPKMHQRNFVLLPLYELNKAWRHPILKQPITKLILSLSNKDIRSIKQI
ncbi:2-amino-4-hydroxy-6-hydroxymethyldihydropteridine diphosphokinase [Candidatus Pelagibacter sp. HIMB1483]|jgi:2-amino-4-hydroxy-6-hydroxymethyldihydropteridine diphosphokinase|uniref:2-amino-4-hydroxy-6- hydroxymethyldihydropteridine diphosphokinase n=1 Tax=Candidatus Pelagibacter sp. HIMB1483 TaxID=3415414 RepID=UPI003F868C97